ncbi:MAG: SseB family protein [Microbacterium sp.]
MALFSRRKKSATDAVAATDDALAASKSESASVDPEISGSEASASEQDETVELEQAPSVGISVQAFRGVGAKAGPAVSLAESEPERVPQASAPPAQTQPAVAEERRLPLAPASPPEQTESVPGMKDNVLLREALAQIEVGASNEQLLGVMRQALQGHLYIRVNGDAQTQIAEGKSLSVAVVRDGDRQYMLAFSSAAAVRDSLQLEEDPSATSAVAQPVTSVMQQVVSGEFAGLIVDNASAPHRAVFPTALLQKALEQGDPDMLVKSLLAAPRAQDTAVNVGRALASKRMWVAVNDGGGSVGIAEARTSDGKRFLQLFSHPLEVVALGRGDRPLPFTPNQLANVLAGHPEMAGVIIDPAGPTLLVERDALAPVLGLAADATS